MNLFEEEKEEVLEETVVQGQDDDLVTRPDSDFSLIEEEEATEPNVSLEFLENAKNRWKAAKAFQAQADASHRSGGLNGRASEEVEEEFNRQQEKEDRKNQEKVDKDAQRAVNRRKAVKEIKSGLKDLAKATGKGLKETARLSYNLIFGKDTKAHDED